MFSFLKKFYKLLSRSVDTPTTLELDLTHIPLVPHTCGGELGQHWFRQWLVACPAPSHSLNKCCLIVNWTIGNKLQWNSKWKTFHSWKCLWNCRLWNSGHIVQGGWVNARHTISEWRYMIHVTLLLKLSQHGGCWWLGSLIYLASEHLQQSNHYNDGRCTSRKPQCNAPNSVSDAIYAYRNGNVFFVGMTSVAVLLRHVAASTATLYSK